jgi:hypothetical protein
MSNLTVGGAGSAQWPDTDWASRKDTVERVDSIQKAVDDERSLGAFANGTARRTSSTAAVTQQDFEAVTRLGPNGNTAKTTDQAAAAPRADRNPFNPAADRKSVNGYDHIMESLRAAALKRDAALAGTSSSSKAVSATTDDAAAEEPRAQYGEAYVRNAIAAYARNSSLN